MAKQAVGSLERHVEKGVLGIALAVLIYVIATYFLTSPNRITLSRGGGETVTPNRIDQLVAEEAQAVRSRLRQAEPEASEVPVLLPEFEKAISPIAYAELPSILPRAVPFLPPVPKVGKGPIPAGTVQLAEVVRLPKPRLAHGRTTLDYVTARTELSTGLNEANFKSAESSRQAVNWVTVSSLFDMAEQKRLNSERYQIGFEDPLLAAVECQRRVQRADGSWHEEDWQDVDPYVLAAFAPVPPIQLNQAAEGSWQIPPDTAYLIDERAQALKSKIVSMTLMRPLMSLQHNGDPWTWPKFEGSDPLVQDTEIAFPDDPVDPANLFNRFAAFEIQKVTTDVKDPEAESRGVPKEPAEARKFMDQKMAEFEQAFVIDNVDQQNQIYNAILVYQRFPLEFDPALVDKSKKLSDEIDKRQNDWKETLANWERACERAKILGRECPPKPKPKGKAGAAVPAAGPRKSSVQQVWVHDAQLDSVRGGKTYQYRMRLVMLNPYAGQPKQLRDPQDAAQWFLYGEWSEPSDPLFIEPDTRFFVRSGRESRNEVAVDVFKWHDGIWVKGSFNVTVGDGVGGESRARVPDQENPNPLINFDTGMTVVDVDFHRPVRSRDRAGRNGIKFGEPDETIALTVVNNDGEAYERLAFIDRDDPDQSALKKRLFQPEAETPEEELTVEQGPRTGRDTGYLSGSRSGTQRGTPPRSTGGRKKGGAGP